MSHGSWEVQEFPNHGRVMVNPRRCDGCGRKEHVVPTEVGTCADGDEVDGCDQLAMKVQREPWMGIRQRGSDVDLNFCSDCEKRAKARNELKKFGLKQAAPDNYQPDAEELAQLAEVERLQRECESPHVRGQSFEYDEDGCPNCGYDAK